MVSVGWMIAAVLGFVAKQKRKAEESPGTMETGWRLTTARGNPRESATETIPPFAIIAKVRVKRVG